MYVRVEIYAATAVLTIATPRFTQALAEDIGAEAMAAVSDDVQTYLVNLEHLTFIGSAAVGVLVRLMKRVGRDRRVELCAPTPPVRKVLRLTRMDTIFRIQPSVAAGLEPHSAPGLQTGSGE